MTLQQIQIETRANDRMQMVIQAIEVKNWSTTDYKKVSDELSGHQGIIIIILE